MKVSVAPGDAFDGPADATIVFLRQASGGAAPWPRPARAAVRRALAGALRLHRPRGTPGETVLLPAGGGLPHPVIAVGTGDASRPPDAALERAAAAAARLARRHDLRRLRIAAAPARAVRDSAGRIRALVRGASAGSYRFDAYRSDDATRPERAPLALVLAGFDPLPAGAARVAREARAEADVLTRVRNLANQPGNEATPAAIERFARKLARDTGLVCDVLDRRALEREGCRALLAVGQGSREAPRMIVLRHAGKRRAARPVVLVGKTITFDAGGISLKPRKNMEWMRYDKSGGMAVLAATAAAARIGLACPVTGILAVAENMPGGGATRPGDIVRARSGKTIEIINTDAEGRLVLADALAYAASFRPRAVVDLATLTGAVIVALGHAAAAVLGTDAPLADALRAAGERVGERLWPLPLWPAYDEALKSDFADVRNIGDGSAGTVAGAAFLKAFAPGGVPWAHLDIAGTAWLEKDRPEAGAGATLFGARLLVEWMRRLEEDPL